MALWDDELEALRPQLREEADAFIASFTLEADDPALPIPERVAKHRAAHDDRVLRSEMAVDREIPGPAGRMRVRTFVPDQVDAVFLHIHGGGFAAGSPEMTDLLHEILSKELNLAFVSVDYRLAPEHPYPAGPDDCEAAAVWLLEHAEAEYGSARLLIGGESAARICPRARSLACATAMTPPTASSARTSSSGSTTSAAPRVSVAFPSDPTS